LSVELRTFAAFLDGADHRLQRGNGRLPSPSLHQARRLLRRRHSLRLSIPFKFRSSSERILRSPLRIRSGDVTFQHKMPVGVLCYLDRNMRSRRSAPVKADYGSEGMLANELDDSCYVGFSKYIMNEHFVSSP